MSAPDEFFDLAVEQRCMEFETVLAWVDRQRGNWPVLRRELATLLTTKDPKQVGDYRVCERKLLDALMIRMANDVAGQPATLVLADALRREAEEEAREAEELAQ